VHIRLIDQACQCAEDVRSRTLSAAKQRGVSRFYQGASGVLSKRAGPSRRLRGRGECREDRTGLTGSDSAGLTIITPCSLRCSWSASCAAHCRRKCAAIRAPPSADQDPDRIFNQVRSGWIEEASTGAACASLKMQPQKLTCRCLPRPMAIAPVRPPSTCYGRSFAGSMPTSRMRSRGRRWLAPRDPREVTAAHRTAPPDEVG
jgi:hypothetical protein